MPKFMLSSEEINSNGGFSFVKKLLNGNVRMKDWDAELPAARNSCYSTSVIVRSTIALMTAGNNSYADIEKFRSDFLFRKVAGGDVPSQETYRQCLDALAEKDWQRILDANVSDQLSRVSLTRIDVDGGTLIPLDIDVSVFEDTASHKEGVSLSYHKVNGYAPIFCYAGREGFMVANELRPGSQHSEKGAVGRLTGLPSLGRQRGQKQALLCKSNRRRDSEQVRMLLMQIFEDFNSQFFGEVQELFGFGPGCATDIVIFHRIAFGTAGVQINGILLVSAGMKSGEKPAKKMVPSML